MTVLEHVLTRRISQLREESKTRVLTPTEQAFLKRMHPLIKRLAREERK